MPILLPKARAMGSHHSARMGKDEWLTPPEILAAFFRFDLDPCAPAAQPWPTAHRKYSLPQDGLALPWEGSVWCNPPYGRHAAKWLARCAAHGNAMALIFARTETKDWQEQVWGKADAILFLFGRLHFHHVDGARAKANSGAPSALIAYGTRMAALLDFCKLPGRFVRLRP